MGLHGLLPFGGVYIGARHMAPAVRTWLARGTAIGLVLFLALFAFDAFEGAGSVSRKVLGFVIHLWPAALVAVVVAFSWRRPQVGAVAFLVLACGYAAWAWDHPGWIAAVSGPLLVVAALHAWAARR